MVWIMMRPSVMWLSQLLFVCFLLWLFLVDSIFASLIFKMPFLMASRMKRYICTNLMVLLTMINPVTTASWSGHYMD
jgi:hypothetical protein